MPSHTYEDVYIPLLHVMADTITSSTVVPTLYRYWETPDELLLSITKPSPIVCV